MNVSQLRHLLAVVDTRSFSRAAEACHLSQPALSRSIRSLEDALGLRLIDRVGKRNELTAAGRTVVERARRIVFEAGELQRIGPQLKAGLAGSVGIGLGSGPGAVLSVPLFTDFGAKHPHVRLTVSRASSSLLLQSLRDRTLDVLVLDVRSVAPAADLAIEMLPEMRAGFFVRTDHPLAARREVDLAMMTQYPIASTPLSDDVARMLVEDFGPGGHPRELVSWCCDDIETLLRAVLETDAVYLGIEAPALPHIADSRLAELRLAPAFRRGARFAILTLAGRAEPPVLAILKSFIRERMQDTPRAASRPRARHA